MVSPSCRSATESSAVRIRSTICSPVSPPGNPAVRSSSRHQRAEDLERDRTDRLVVLALVDADVELVHAVQGLDREPEDRADLRGGLLRARQRRCVDRRDATAGEPLPRCPRLLAARAR